MLEKIGDLFAHGLIAVNVIAGVMFVVLVVMSIGRGVTNGMRNLFGNK